MLVPGRGKCINKSKTGGGRDEQKKAYIRTGNLRQINLIRQMPITHAVLVSVASGPSPAFLPRATNIVSLGGNQLAQVPVIVHLQVHAYPPVQTRARGVYVHIGDAAFDDAREHGARLLVGCDADFGFVSRIQVILDDVREGFGGDFVKGVAFFFVCVRYGDAGGAGGHGRCDGLVEKVV